MRFFISLFFSFSILLGFSQENRAISQANTLIAKKQYLSAYKLLDGSDPNNQSPEIAIAKTNLLLNFHLSTKNYHHFGLKNLAPNENIEDYGVEVTDSNNIYFQPDSILNKLIRQYPQEYSLQKALGGFYYEVHCKYPDNWILPDKVVLEKMTDNYLTAYQNNVYDYWSLFGLGYSALLKNENENAILYLEKSLKLNSDYPLTYYNLASAYYNLKQYNKSLELALNSYKHERVELYKATTGRLIGMICNKINRKREGYSYFKESNELIPNDYNTLLELLKSEIDLNEPNYKNRTLEIFSLAPENPIVYKDILDIYKKEKKTEEFTKFLEEQKSSYRTKNQALANIFFYTAISLYETKNWTQAKINFEKARQTFSTFYDDNHTIFEVINSYTNALKKK